MFEYGSMPKRTIANNFIVVIFSALISVIPSACHRPVVEGGRPPLFDGEATDFQAAKVVGRIESGEITESSGIAVSKCQENVLWTHNDSGDGPFVFAMDATGRDLGTWKVTGAENIDWEDIATFRDAGGKCFVYVSDTGNSRRDPRTELKVYRFAEPTVAGSGPRSTRKEPAPTAPAEVLVFSYPDEPQDAETLLVHPASGEIYIATKDRKRAAGVYALGAAFGRQLITGRKVSDLTVPAIPNGFLTGGDISPDGRHLIICDDFAAYEFTLPPGNADFNNIWKQKPAVVELGDRKQGEAVGYSADGNSIFATSEGKNPPLIRVNRRQIKTAALRKRRSHLL